MYQHISKRLRLRLIQKAHYTCSRCGQKKDSDSFDIHHSNDELLVLCRSCHAQEHKVANTNQRQNVFVVVGKERLKLTDVKLLPLVAKLIKKHPEYKYRLIAEKLHTTEAYVKKCASLARKRNLL